ncbi:hypothetical protein KEJ27_08545 [Candidatus Bathyarchaeota archaeon]|nr:hypothetical protein [Candidatus Bathyarchaeota archaeon]
MLSMSELSALVIRINEKIKDLGDLLAIARAEAQKKHHVKGVKIEILDIAFIPRLNVYVALYKTPVVRGRRCEPKA